VSEPSKIKLYHPIKFHDFSEDKEENYCGYGLKSVKQIKKGEAIADISTDLGLVSDILDDGIQSEKLSEGDFSNDQDHLLHD